jgi:chorismate dehydratase
MAQGPQRSQVKLSYEIPAVCADVVARGEAQLGLVPVAEIARQNLEVIPGYGIASRGAVRSILLVARQPIREIKTLAVDASSRTSVQLARVILRELYGATPNLTAQQPDLEAMLASSDAALVIGDAALRIDPYALPYEVLDLGAEWCALTDLPMVFALWSGRAAGSLHQAPALLENSYRYGMECLPQILDQEIEKRGISRALGHEYLTGYIQYRIGETELKGLETFLKLAGFPQIEAALAQAS